MFGNGFESPTPAGFLRGSPATTPYYYPSDSDLVAISEVVGKLSCLQPKAQALWWDPAGEFASCQHSLLQATLALGCQGLWSELCDTKIQLL